MSDYLQRVPKELAVKLEEIGFDLLADEFYIDEAIAWFRREKGIFIFFNFNNIEYFFTIEVVKYTQKSSAIKEVNGKEFVYDSEELIYDSFHNKDILKTWEEAQIAALYWCCEYLLKNKKPTK